MITFCECRLNARRYRETGDGRADIQCNSLRADIQRKELSVFRRRESGPHRNRESGHSTVLGERTFNARRYQCLGDGRAEIERKEVRDIRHSISFS